MTPSQWSDFLPILDTETLFTFEVSSSTKFGGAEVNRYARAASPLARIIFAFTLTHLLFRHVKISEALSTAT
jgi:hypothetical protein